MSEDKNRRSLDSIKERHRYRKSGAGVVKIRTEHNGLSLLKTMLTLFLVFLQLGIILSLNFFFMIGLKWYLITLFVISIITAVSVLLSHRSSQAKVVWVLFILVFFMFGFVVYFMSDDKIMYHRARKRHHKIFDDSAKFCKPYEEYPADGEMLKNCRYLQSAAGFVPYTNTKVKYFPSGASMFDDALREMESAEKFVFIEYFAVADGVLLKRVWDILERKLKEGVDVRIIYDDMGSRVLSLKTRKMMRKAGAKIRVFNRLLSRFSFALNYRDHRKIIVIDGKTAYTGGCNLADEYINEKRMYGYWKDTGLRLTGEAADAMTLSFLRQWEYIVKEPVDYAPFIGNSVPEESTSVVLPYVGGPEFEYPICKSVYQNLICSAKEKLYIMTPYFVPDDDIMQDIINCAQAGVDVRIVLPSIPDKYYVYILTKEYAERLVSYGVKVYYVEDAFVHGKVVLTEKLAAVGSVNFDMRSFYQQFENAVLTDDEGVRQDVEADFNQTFKDSILAGQPQKKSFVKRVIVSALRIVAPLM